MNLEPKRKMPNVRYSIFFIIVKGSQGFVRRVRLLAQCALATSGGSGGSCKISQGGQIFG